MDEPTTTANPLAAQTVTYGEGHPHAGIGGHAGDSEYVRIALVLGALTAIEVALSYAGGLHGLFLIIPLFAVMAIKFGLVGAYFMHLRYDSRMLSRVFYFGLATAVSVYVVALLSLKIFKY